MMRMGMMMGVLLVPAGIRRRRTTLLDGGLLRMTAGRDRSGRHRLLVNFVLYLVTRTGAGTVRESDAAVAAATVLLFFHACVN